MKKEKQYTSAPYAVGNEICRCGYVFEMRYGDYPRIYDPNFDSALDGDENPAMCYWVAKCPVCGEITQL